MVESSESQWQIEPFDKSALGSCLRERTHFDCVHAALNDWLRRQVSQFEKRDLSRTYVLVVAGDSTVRGYYALSNHTVVYEALPSS